MTSYQQDKRIPEGPYFVTDDDAEDCPDHSHSGLAKVDTGRSGDWPIARLCEWPTAEMIASIPEMLTTIADQRAAMDGLAEALIAQIPKHRNPANVDGRCWCSPFLEVESGHEDHCKQANAALAAVENLTQLLVFDLDKAERIGEQLTRNSPVVNGPAKVEP